MPERARRHLLPAARQARPYSCAVAGRAIRTPDQRLRVFVSSTLGELEGFDSYHLMRALDALARDAAS